MSVPEFVYVFASAGGVGEICFALLATKSIDSSEVVKYGTHKASLSSDEYLSKKLRPSRRGVTGF